MCFPLYDVMFNLVSYYCTVERHGRQENPAVGHQIVDELLDKYARLFSSPEHLFTADDINPRHYSLSTGVPASSKAAVPIVLDVFFFLLITPWQWRSLVVGSRLSKFLKPVTLGD